MADLGFLNFGVGVDGEDLLAKALEADKKEALEVQKILASLKIPGVQFGNPDAAISKSQQAADKAALSSVKLGDAREKAAASSLLGEQKLQTELERTTAIQGKSAAEIAAIEKQAADKAILNQKKIATEAERAAAVRSSASNKTKSNEASIASILKDQEAKQRIMSQKLLTEIERTNAAKLRGMKISSEGQVSFNNSAGLTNKTLFDQKNLLNQISNAAGIYFSIYQVGAFVKNLALVSGEFEMQKISLENILQDVDAANKLFGQIKGLSVVSPFEFKDLVGYAKQLSAFSIPVNELYDTTKRLADVSAGLGVDMGRIILAYGQVRSASVLRGQELRQFTEVGIPLVDELAKKFGELEGRVVSAGEVFDKISNRLVPFAMVKDVFNDLTSEGGKFFEMQERQSESLKGKIANLKDAYDIMLYSIGTANDGILKGGVEGITELMKNWENLSNVLIGVIGAIGAYKAAVISKTAIDSLASKGIVYNNALTALSAIVQKKANEVTLGNIALKEKQAIASISLRACTASEAASEVVLQMAKKTSLSTDAAKLLSETAMITIRRAGNDQVKIAAAVEAIKTSAMRKGLSATVASAIAEGARAAATTASSVATKGLTASLWALMATNPIGWIIGIIAAIGGAAYAIYHFSSETSKAKDSISELIGTEFTMFETMADDLKSLISKLRNVTTGSVEYYQILKEINNKYGEYLPNMDKENDKLLALEKSYNAVTEAIKNKQKQEAYTKANEKVEETYSDDISKETTDIRKKLKAIGISAKDAAILIKKFNDNVKEIGDETSSTGEGSFETRFRRIVMEYFGKDSKAWNDFNNISQMYDPLFTSILGDIDDLGDALTKKFSMLDFSSNQVDAQFSESFNIKGLTTELENLENAHKETISRINIEYENSGKSRNEIELAIYNSTKEYQKKILQTKFEFGEINAEKLEAGLKQIEKPLSGVKQVVNETIDSIKGLTDAEKHNIKIKDDDTSSVNEYIKSLKDQYDSMQENITMMLKMKAVSGAVKLLKNGKTPSPYSVDAVVSAEDVISQENQLKAILAVITALGQLDKKKKEKKEKDPRIEELQKEIGLIKEAYGEYDKLSKVMSKPLAMAKVKEQERYKNVNIPSDQKGMLDREKEYGDKLVALKSKEGKDAAESFYKGYATGSIALGKEAIDKMMDSVSKEIDKFKDGYDFYEKLLGAGEDKQTAIKIAFGVEFTGNEIDPAKYFSDKIKEAAKEAKFEIDFDINKGNIKDQLGDAYNDLTPELKKQIDTLETWREAKMKESYMNYMKYTENNDTELFGTGALLDMSKVSRDAIKAYAEIDKKQKEAMEGLNSERSKFSDEEYNDRVSKINAIHGLEVKNAQKEKQEKLNDLADVLIKQKLDEAGVLEIFNNVSTASFKDIKRIQEVLEGLDVVALPDEILTQLAKAKLSVEDLKKVLDSLSKGKQDTVEDKKISKIANIAKAAAQSVGELGSALAELGEATGNSALADVGGFLQDFSDFASSAIDITEGIMSGDPAKVIQGITSVITKLIKGQSEYIKAKKEYELSQLQFQREYRILMLEQQLDFEKGNTVFGEDPYGKVKNSMDVYRKSLKELANEQEKVGRMDVVTGTKKKKFLGITTGHKDVYGNILSAYPNLIDNQGKFDTEVAKTILSTQKMSDETRQWLETMISYSKQAEDALEEMHNYMTDVFGELGNTMSDALVDAFKNGTDASDVFYDSVSSMLENLAKDMIYSVTLAPLMEKYQKMMEDVMGNTGLSDGQKFKQWSDILNSLVGDAINQQDIANGLMGKYQEIAKNNGIDIFNPDAESKQGLSKGIAGVTEDTANLLASYLNAMRADLSNQKIYLQKIIDAIIPMSNNFALQVAELKKIEANTYRTANNTEKNVEVLNEVKAILKSVTTQGSGKKLNV